VEEVEEVEVEEGGGGGSGGAGEEEHDDIIIIIIIIIITISISIIIIIIIIIITIIIITSTIIIIIIIIILMIMPELLMPLQVAGPCKEPRTHIRAQVTVKRTLPGVLSSAGCRLKCILAAAQFVRMSCQTLGLW